MDFSQDPFGEAAVDGFHGLIQGPKKESVAISNRLFEPSQDSSNDRVRVKK